MPTMITKTSGKVVAFDPKKVLNSMIRSGSDLKTAKATLKKVESRLKPKMKTSEIYKIVREELKSQIPWVAARYNLREAIFKLGPHGFNFEKYVAAILSAYGYKTDTPDIFQGACITHETDVTAEKEGRTAFIEAKFRHNFKSSITIKDTMATWARFLDLVDGSKIGLCPHFDEAWIVTNARFTDQSLKYGHCKNMVLIGWNHPKERTFAQMVDLNSLYPMTVIEDLTDDELTAFAKADIMLCRELCEGDLDKISRSTKISKKRLKSINSLCDAIIKTDMPKQRPKKPLTKGKKQAKVAKT